MSVEFVIDGDIRTIWSVIDLVLRTIPQPARRYALLDHLREGVDRRLRSAEEDVRRERAKTPPARRPSGAIPAVEGATLRHPKDDR